MNPSHDPGVPGEAGGLSRRALLRAHLHMETHIGESLRLDDIARAAHLSRSHFARAFRISTGLSVMNYLRRLRLEKAKLLLIESEAGIAELSARLGFSHHSHFTRLFRQDTGMTPRTFARLYGNPCAERPAEGAAWHQEASRDEKQHESSS